MDEQRGPDLFTLAREATVSGVTDLLAEGRTPQTAVEVAQSAGKLLDNLNSGLDQAHRPACRARCPWCCYLSVACTPPEAISVAAYVQAGLTKRVRRGIAARLTAFCDQTRGLDARARARLRLPCPFLDDAVCLVHPARPLACRGWHSFDVGQCKRHWEDPSVLVEASGARLALRGAVSSAMSDSLKRGGLNGDGVELAAAVQLVLGDQDTVKAWLRGEDAFATARWIS